MASLASFSGAIGTLLCHAVLELTFVNVLMATGAVQILPVVHHRLRLKLFRFFVAVATRNRHMASGQDELRLLVLGQRKRRGFVSLDGVAFIAGVEIRRRHKLPGVLILMAVGAILEFHFEQRVLAFRDMALGALHSGVSAHQRIRAGRVLFYTERRRLPALHGVTIGTFGSSRTFRELPIVWIGFMAVGALVEQQRFLEVSAGVTLLARHSGMLALKRILGLGVIEILGELRRRNSFPARRRVTGRTGLLERAVMRILVAV